MKNNLGKNISMLYIMNIAKIIFPMLTLPYLTRVLTMDCYGVVSYVKAVMQYMQIIVDFAFVLSGTKDIVRAKDDPAKLREENGTILIAKIGLSGIALVILCICTLIIPILKKNVLYTMLSFIPVFLTCFLFDYLFRGLERMEVITIRYVVMKGFSTILTFVFVHGDVDVLWIPVLDIIGSLIAVVLVFFEVRKLHIDFAFSGLKAVVSKVVDSAVYFISSMATTAFMALNTLVIGIYLDTTQVAYWSVCLQMTNAVQSLYKPLTDGIYPHMVTTRNFGVIKKALKIYMPIICAGCVFTLLVAKYAMIIVGGSEYAAAANVLRCLVPVLFFSFLSMLFGWPCLGAIDRQNQVTKSTVITAIVQILGLILLAVANRFTVINIALLRGFTEALMSIIRMYYCYRYRKEFKNI
ncbi:MAG: oligosaccharide flippase family protein [Lachnospiraceae bacterium]|nr:oligosaccharide flippase family protein [Lachnospiraceae bacterium]